jgi:hypothetical protein
MAVEWSQNDCKSADTMPQTLSRHLNEEGAPSRDQYSHHSTFNNDNQVKVFGIAMDSARNAKRWPYNYQGFGGIENFPPLAYEALDKVVVLDQLCIALEHIDRW